MCNWLEDLFFPLYREDDTGVQRRGLQLEPRYSYKSSIASKGLPLLLLEKYPDSAGLIDSHSWDRSKVLLRGCKDIIEKDKHFRDVFGDWAKDAPYWTESGIIINRRTSAGRPEPSIDTTGVDKGMAGGHYDWIIADDLHDEQNYESPRMREKVKGHIENLYPLLAPGGALLLIGTRWHYQDSYGKILRDVANAAEIGGRTPWVTRIKAVEDQYGELYFPHRLTREFIEQQRIDLSPNKFSVWYYNKPIEEGSKTFQKSYIQMFEGDFDYDWQPILRPKTQPEGRIPLRTTFSWDTAGVHPGEATSYHGLTVVGTDVKGNWVVIVAEGLKGTPTEVISRVAYLIAEYGIEEASIEDVPNSLLWLDKLQRYMADKGAPCPTFKAIVPSSRMRKTTRIETALEMRFRRRQVWILAGPQARDVLAELDQFPQGPKLDILDALAQQDQITQNATDVADDEFFQEQSWQERHPERVKSLSAQQTSGSWVGLGTPQGAKNVSSFSGPQFGGRI